MLAQNFKTAADLGIRDVEVAALIKVLGMLERGEIGHQHFDMGCIWLDNDYTDCGSVGCLCGWAHHIEGAAFPELDRYDPVSERLPPAALTLFAMNGGLADLQCRIQRTATPASAAAALRSYLTTGDADWETALSSTMGAKS